MGAGLLVHGSDSGVDVEAVPFAGGEAGAVPPCNNAFFTALW